eukprot:13145017-Ditylum_brightwellii.AAC.1
MSEPQARSRAGEHFFLSEPSTDPNKPPSSNVPLNRPVHSMCEIMRQVMASTAEAEIGALFSNTRMAKSCDLPSSKWGTPNCPPRS